MYYKSFKVKTPQYYEYELVRTYTVMGCKCYVLKKVQGKRRLPKYLFLEKWVVKEQKSNFRLCSYPFKPNSLNSYLYENENNAHLPKHRWQTGMYELEKAPSVFYGDKEGKPHAMLASYELDEFEAPEKLKVFYFLQCYNKNRNDEKKANWCIRNLKYWINKLL